MTTDTYSVAGSYSWVCPAGVTSVKVEVYAGGGGGRGGVNLGRGGSSGGSGEYRVHLTYPVTPGNSYAVIVGAGGTGGSYNTNSQTSGANSSFDAAIVAVSGKAPVDHTVGGLAGTGGSGGTGTNGNAGATSANSIGSDGAAGGNGVGPLAAAGGAGGITGDHAGKPGAQPGAGGGGGKGNNSLGAGGNGGTGAVYLTYEAGPPTASGTVSAISGTTGTGRGAYHSAGTVAAASALSGTGYASYHASGSVPAVSSTSGTGVATAQVFLGTAVETDSAIALEGLPGLVSLGTAVETSSAVALRPLGVYADGAAQTVEFRPGPGLLSTPPQVGLILLTSELPRSPGILQVRVTTVDPGAVLTFTVYAGIDSWLVWTDVADSSGELGLTSIDLPGDLFAGTYTLEVDTVNNGSDSASFVLVDDPEVYPVDATGDLPPEAVPASEGRWVFQDLNGALGSWIMPINPRTMTNPHFERNVQVRHTTSPYSGQYLVSEAGFTGKPWRLAGYCPDQAYYEKLVAYAGLQHRIYVIDHRGRAWKVGIQSLSIEPRKRQADDVDQNNDWAGEWSMDLVIYDQTPEVP